MKVAALCQPDTQSEGYRKCAELAVRLGFLRSEATGPDPRERTAPNTIRAQFTCISSLTELAPLDPASVKSILDHGGSVEP